MTVNLGTKTIIDCVDGNKSIVLAGGCFWGTEAFLKKLPGVSHTFTAYANGGSVNPTYDDVCAGLAEHAEAVFVEYDPTVIDLRHLLRFFFRTIDPLSVNQQGGDRGRQYRTAVMWLDSVDVDVIQQVFAEIAKKLGVATLETTVEALQDLSSAEGYHQDYLTKNPGGYCHVSFAHLPQPGEPTKGDDYGN